MSYLDIVSPEDLRAYEKGKFLAKMGFGRRPAVIVVDMTYAFIDPRYPLASEISRQMGGKAIASIKLLLKEARSRSVPIVYSKAASESGLLFNIGVSRKEAERAVREGTRLIDPEANEIVKEIAPQGNDLVITKIRASIFFGTPLVSYLVYNNVDTLIITGMTTSGCVRASVVDAASYNFRVVVPEECVADRAVVPHKVNLFDMAMKYADVVPLSEVLAYLATLTPEQKAR